MQPSSSKPNDLAKAYIFENKQLRILDQRQLPNEEVYVNVADSNTGYMVIKDMLVRGAPCIAAVGCLSIVSELNGIDSMDKFKAKSIPELITWVEDKSTMLMRARTTAVNLKNALDTLNGYTRKVAQSVENASQLIEVLTKFCIHGITASLRTNIQLSELGSQELLNLLQASHKDTLSILTHCNTGSLATAGHGTALGVVKTLHIKAKLEQLYFTETRPLNQGLRLTGFECYKDGLPATAICDNMVAYLMKTHQIDAVVVGADRIARNGDVANKIGTLQIAIIASHYAVPFYVVAPCSTIDFNSNQLQDDNIEQRSDDEIRIMCGQTIVPAEIGVWNPAFDITPAELVTRIVTEMGCCSPNDIAGYQSKWQKTKPEGLDF